MDISVPETLSTAPVVRFGIFEADLRSGELHRSGVKVRIQELPFHALKTLVSHPNEVVSRDDLRKALWPVDVHVEFDRGVISAINRLRDALGDSAENPVFIETVGRRGYRWIAPLQFVDAGQDGGLRDPASMAGLEEAWTGTWRLVAGIERLVVRRANFLFVLLVVALLCAAGGVWVRFGGSNAAGKAGSFTGRPGSGRGAANRPSANPEAEKFYLEGRYYWEKRTPESLTKAVDAFTQAIVLDSGYAPAYVGLADSYNLLREYTVMPAYEAYPRALAAAKKAVELDPESSEAHASLAFASFFGMWEVATADQEFRRAIELNPNNAAAHHWYATYLSCLRRYPESLVEIDRAQALDPASKSVLADKGSLLFSAGRRRDSVVLLKQMEENEPDFISPHRYLKFIYLVEADYSNYLMEARKEAVLMHDSGAIATVDATEKGFAAGGGRGLLEVLSAEQKKRFDSGEFSPFLLAATYALMGEKRETLRYLKIAGERRVDGVIEITSDPAFNSLHGDAEFQKLVAQLGLPPVS